jgi:hypothetical protein
MTARPMAESPAGPNTAAGRPVSEWLLVGACAALMAAAVLPFARVFVGVEFARPVAAAILLSLGGQSVARRAGGGPLTGLLVGIVAWSMFVALAFLPASTLYGGFVPTSETLRAGAELFADGVELVRTRPAPTFPVPGLMVLTVTGVWWVAHAVDVLAIRLRSPLHAVAAALVLWTVPLAVTTTPGGQAWRWAVPLLIAAVAVLLLGSDTARMGRARRVGGGSVAPASGWVTGLGAVVAGVLLVGLVPGFGERALVQPGGSGGGLTTTDNPMVDIRSNLVDQSRIPVARVSSPEPVYLRLTSLERFDAGQRWTNDGIRGDPVSGPLPAEAQQPLSRSLNVEVEALGLSGAVLVPAPYQPRAISSPRLEDLRWDSDLATLTMTGDERLANGDSYELAVEVPNPPLAALREVDVSEANPALTRVPELPEEVGTLARRIVSEAGAEAAVDRALAIQQELRSWEYSLNPPAGHGSNAMRSFIQRRVGYCEQFAGTMAAMLRSLGIPARVAVGFTPGERVGDSEYIVRRANAHAWVEVLFPDYGWVSFEPTPRSDGNVLTPGTEAGMAPTQLDSQLTRRPQSTATPDFGQQQGPPQQPTPSPAAPDAGPDAEAAGGQPAGGGLPWTWLGVAVVGLAGGGLLWARRQPRSAAIVAPGEVLARVQRVERLGAGLGRPREASETDAEYLAAVARDAQRAEPLIAAVERARWAPSVPAGADEAAGEAEAAIRAHRLGGLGRVARAMVAVRSWGYGARCWAKRARAGEGRRAATLTEGPSRAR